MTISAASITVPLEQLANRTATLVPDVRFNGAAAKSSGKYVSQITPKFGSLQGILREPPLRGPGKGSWNRFASSVFKDLDRGSSTPQLFVITRPLESYHDSQQRRLPIGPPDRRKTRHRPAMRRPHIHK